MAFSNIMSDPANAEIALELETLIAHRDSEAAARGITLKDGHVKSAIVKAVNLLKGKRPKAKPKTVVDEEVLALAEEMVILAKAIESGTKEADGDELRVMAPLKKTILVYRAVEESVQTRHEMRGGPRGYLDFLIEFLSKG